MWDLFPACWMTHFWTFSGKWCRLSKCQVNVWKNKEICWTWFLAEAFTRSRPQCSAIVNHLTGTWRPWHGVNPTLGPNEFAFLWNSQGQTQFSFSNLPRSSFCIAQCTGECFRLYRGLNAAYSCRLYTAQSRKSPAAPDFGFGEQKKKSCRTLPHLIQWSVQGCLNKPSCDLCFWASCYSKKESACFTSGTTNKFHKNVGMPVVQRSIHPAMILFYRLTPKAQLSGLLLQGWGHRRLVVADVLSDVFCHQKPAGFGTSRHCHLNQTMDTAWVTVNHPF